MIQPRISVLMPAYNSEKYIAEAIESILNQTFTDFEFIIINDGSTDNTAKIVKEYAKKDNRIRFINHSKNKGFIGCLNECLDIAHGEYVAKMDSDDISLPTRLEKQVKFLDENLNVGMVGCGYRAFDKGSFEVIHVANVGLLDLLKTCATTIIMARKSVIDDNNLRFNPDFIHAEDYDFYSRFIKYAPICNLREVLYLYRWHGNNASITNNAIQQDKSKIVRDNIIDFITGGNYNSEQIYNLINSIPKTGILLPKWLGKICCLFILRHENRVAFRARYVKN